MSDLTYKSISSLYGLISLLCIWNFFPVLGGGLFGQPAQNLIQSNQLYNAASALNAPTLLGDERDAILAKWNQLQALWGTGKGYFNSNIPPVEFTQENHFCRFKVTYRHLHYTVYFFYRWEKSLLSLLLK